MDEHLIALHAMGMFLVALYSFLIADGDTAMEPWVDLADL